MADAKIISSFQNTVATTLGVNADKIINIKAKSKRRQLFGRELAAAYQLFGRELAEAGCSVDDAKFVRKVGKKLTVLVQMYTRV